MIPHTHGPSKSVRLSHVISKGNPLAGAALNTFYSADFLKHRYRTEVVMGNDGPLRELCEAHGIPAVIIPFRNVLADPLGDLRGLARLTRHFRRTRPTIVHTHSSKAGTIGRLAAWLAGVPIVIHTWHGASFHDQQPGLVRAAVIILERLLDKITHAHVSVTETLAREVVANGITSAERIQTVVSGIPFDSFPKNRTNARIKVRTSLGLEPDDLLIISVAEYVAKKGHDLLVEAAPTVVGRVPGARFLIVGADNTSEPHLSNALTNRIRALGLNDHFTLMGHRSDVPELLTAADVIVQTSWREGLSRSLVEGLYTGLPAVATNVGATAEIVRDGLNGYLIPPGDRVSLATRLVELLSDAGRRLRMGREATASIGPSRNVEAMGNGLNNLYQRLLEEAGYVEVPAKALVGEGARGERFVSADELEGEAV